MRDEHNPIGDFDDYGLYVPKVWQDHVRKQLLKPNPFLAMLPKRKPLSMFGKIKCKAQYFKYRLQKAYLAFKDQD